MKKYWRWIVFGVIALVLIVLLVLVGANKKLRQRVESLLLERFIKTKVKNLEDKAAVLKANVNLSDKEAEEAEVASKEIELEISKQKETLEKGLEKRGMSSDEISDRFNNLNI